MTQGLFITGTGTEVGKTVVTAGLLRGLRARGVDAVPAKPVQTGGTPCDGGFQAPDLQFALAVAGLEPDADELRLMSPYCYEPACSPHLAGRMAQHYPDAGHIKTCVETLADQHDCVLVEGAGGIMVPLDESTSTLDLMCALGWPVLLVSHTGLGTINHTLLSVEVLRAAGLDILGVVFNNIEEGTEDSAFIRADNPETIARFGKIEVLGNIRHLAGLAEDTADLWEQFEADLPGLPAILERVTQP